MRELGKESCAGVDAVLLELIVGVSMLLFSTAVVLFVLFPYTKVVSVLCVGLFVFG